MIHAQTVASVNERAIADTTAGTITLGSLNEEGTNDWSSRISIFADSSQTTPDPELLVATKTSNYYH